MELVQGIKKLGHNNERNIPLINSIIINYDYCIKFVSISQN